MTSPDATREWFAEYLDACNRHDLAAIRGFLAPDVRRSHLERGADAWIRDLDELFHAFPDWQWTRVSVIVEDDRLAGHLRAGGTHRGTFLHLAATGRHVNLAEFATYRITDGRITESASSTDAATLRKLLTHPDG